ncbi:MAG: hypothetical protein BGP14_21355 [Sphingobacteriales bacterium 44-15]|nr:MAG: hypothetical protein BGP14_21355 [Sphingobacteriales bacterium 44-15]
MPARLTPVGRARPTARLNHSGEAGCRSGRDSIILTFGWDEAPDTPPERPPERTFGQVPFGTGGVRFLSRLHYGDFQEKSENLRFYLNLIRLKVEVNLQGQIFLVEYVFLYFSCKLTYK